MTRKNEEKDEIINFSSLSVEKYKKHKEEREQSDYIFFHVLRQVVSGEVNPIVLNENFNNRPLSINNSEKMIDEEKKKLLDDLKKRHLNEKKDDNVSIDVKETVTKDIENQNLSKEISDVPQHDVAKKRKIFETLLFYAFLVGVIAVAGNLLGGSSTSGTPRNIMGYAPMTILTKSMQSVYPKDSLVITKTTDPKTLKIGDDVTYLKENNTSITHRIVGITENYLGTGARGFETKGVNNPKSDAEIVRAENVVGKVVFSSKFLGQLIFFIRKNLILTIIIVCLSVFLFDLLLKTFKNPTNFKKIKDKDKGIDEIKETNNVNVLNNSSNTNIDSEIDTSDHKIKNKKVLFKFRKRTNRKKSIHEK